MRIGQPREHRGKVEVGDFFTIDPDVPPAGRREREPKAIVALRDPHEASCHP
jgi:hypothetical protein